MAASDDTNEAPGSRSPEGPPVPLFNPPASMLGGRNAILSGTRRDHHVPAFEGCLSIKSVVRGHAVWRTADAEYRVDERCCLLLDDRQRYTLTIEAARPVTTFCVFFERGFVEDAFATLASSDRARLDDPGIPSRSQGFTERLETSDTCLFQGMEGFRAAVLARAVGPGSWVDRFHALAAAVVREELRSKALVRRFDAVRRATREELRRRVLRGRDHLLSALDQPVRLADAAAAAGLSPFHFHRAFTRAFRCTPHAYLTLRRLERAAWLLSNTRLRVTDVCLECGFASLASFGLLFRRHYGRSPRAFRQDSK